MLHSKTKNSLETLANVAMIANYFKTREIEKELSGISRLMYQKSHAAKIQNLLKQFIFEIRDYFSKQFQHLESETKLFVTEIILWIFETNNLTSANFEKIEDKQIFSDLKLNVEKEKQSLSNLSNKIDAKLNTYKLYLVFKLESQNLRLFLTIIKQKSKLRNWSVASCISVVVSYFYFSSTSMEYRSENQFITFVILLSTVIILFSTVYDIWLWFRAYSGTLNELKNKWIKMIRNSGITLNQETIKSEEELLSRFVDVIDFLEKEIDEYKNNVAQFENVENFLSKMFYFRFYK